MHDLKRLFLGRRELKLIRKAYSKNVTMLWVNYWQSHCQVSSIRRDCIFSQLQLAEAPSIITKKIYKQVRGCLLGQCLRAAIRTILQALPWHKFKHSLPLFSANDCIHSESSKNIVLVSFWFFLEVSLFNCHVSCACDHARFAGTNWLFLTQSARQWNSK